VAIQQLIPPPAANYPYSSGGYGVTPATSVPAMQASGTNSYSMAAQSPASYAGNMAVSAAGTNMYSMSAQTPSAYAGNMAAMGASTNSYNMTAQSPAAYTGNMAVSAASTNSYTMTAQSAAAYAGNVAANGAGTFHKPGAAPPRQVVQPRHSPALTPKMTAPVGPMSEGSHCPTDSGFRVPSRCPFYESIMAEKSFLIIFRCINIVKMGSRTGSEGDR
jgi:hypothetical protein